MSFSDMLDYFGLIVNGFSAFVTVVTEKKIFDTPIILLLLGGALALYVFWVVAKWIIDILPES